MSLRALRLAALGALVWITGASGLVGCGQSMSTPESCPSQDVKPDVTVRDLSPGEYQLEGPCLVYCPAGFPVCQLREGNVVRCQKNCL